MFVQIFVLVSLLKHSNSISIEGQLTVIKNGCYDRLAIGEKLSPKQVYKTFVHNTVPKCEMECTKEEETCRAFSFGIGAKGNGTCYLSKTPIKETAALKPIGTITDPEYDLYVKKLDCHIVFEPPQAVDSSTIQIKPLSDGQDYYYDETNHHHHHHYASSSNDHTELSTNQNQHYTNQPHSDDYGNGYHYNKPSTQSHSDSETHHVQTLVSIASGPQSVMHPVHDILVSGDSYRPERPLLRPNGYGGNNDNLFPYRPVEQQNYPYDDCGPQPQLSHRPVRPYPDYGDGEDTRPPAPIYHPNQVYNDHGPIPPPNSNDRPIKLPFGYFPQYNFNSNDDLRPLSYPTIYEYGNAKQYAIDRRKYESFNQFNSYESEIYRPNPDYNSYGHYDKLQPSRPNRYGSFISHPNDYVFNRPNLPSQHDDRKPAASAPNYDKPTPIQNNNIYDKTTNKPIITNNNNSPSTIGYNNNDDHRPATSSSIRPGIPLKRPSEINRYDNVDYSNKHYGKPEYGTRNEGNKIISESIGKNGERITSIITELPKACFRRTLAGKRVMRGLVRKLLLCDTAEQCQHECGDERHFTCEGFNYRLDPTGRGKGECELLDLPITKIDLTREVASDPDYDYYTRDRNAVAVNCRQPPSISHTYQPSGYDDSRRRPTGNGGYDYQDGGGSLDGYGRRPIGLNYPIRRPSVPWNYDDYERRPIQYHIPEEERRPIYENRRGDYSFHHHHSHESHSSYSHNEHIENRFDFHGYEDRKPFSGIHYLPASHIGRPHNDFPPYGTDTFISRPVRPTSDRFLDKPSSFSRPYYRPTSYGYNDNNYWGINSSGWGSYGGHYGDVLPFKYDPQRFDKKKYENPRRGYEPSKNWGRYGGSYGTGGLTLEYLGYGNRHAFSYWGFDKYHDDQNDSFLLPPKRKFSGKPISVNYLPLPTPTSENKHYLPTKPLDDVRDLDNSILPLEPRRPSTFHSIQDECSLRTAAGFRLHKRIVKKYLSVPNIYECELLCVKEKEFFCASYAYRYSINLQVPTDNCYLSNRNYKELDYYIDMEPDRDFDVYTMNNRKSCTKSAINLGREVSDCFWRVRSGHRLSESVARDSLNVQSIIDCQIECLNSKKFACRAYSFRYGSSVIGGIIDNCQLTDWPFFELDVKKHFIPDPHFEIYDRGSFGHGCETNHFGIRGKPNRKNNAIKLDKLCYIGFGSPAKLLPQATIKSLFVPTELDCKIECSKAREDAYFRCVSFSFRTEEINNIDHNCYLSDIMQRDLLPNIDYIYDPDSWLFMWDDYNPECTDLHSKYSDNQASEYRVEYNWKYDLDTWSIYSVSGQPCRKGTKCRQNKIGGFWYCELEGPDRSAWDYCCSPDHRCGLSKGYRYTWCYVGPQKTQWRKCNDYYYPYGHSTVDRFDRRPEYHSRPHVIHHRPNRPDAPARPLPIKPSLNEYEEQFDNEFLGPPKPGGFGRARRWPISYLHKGLPLNDTDTDFIPMETEQENSRISAIKSLINVIKNNEFDNLQYRIVNDSDKSDDVLFVKIPLPSLNETAATNSSPTDRQTNIENKTSITKISITSTEVPRPAETEKSTINYHENNSVKMPIIRKGFVTRTNATNWKWDRRAFEK